MDATTFATMAEIRLPSLPTLQAAVEFWWTAIPRRSGQARAACVMEPLWRPLRQRCKKSLAARGGRSWTQVAGCGAGKSTAILAKTNLSVRASYRGGRVRLLLNTITPTRESSIDVKPFSVRLDLNGDLDFFLGSKTGRRRLERSLSEKTSVKDVIESCGVPHPEVDVILVNGMPVDFNYAIAGDADIEVHPVGTRFPHFKDKRLQVTKIIRFTVDGHLGKLARHLRLLGFDVAYDPPAEDRQLLEIMKRENRALLTRDRRLL